MSRSKHEIADLMVTHTADGPAYGTETGKPVTTKRAREIQADLFVKPQEDGLFPGFSQTWKMDAPNYWHNTASGAVFIGPQPPAGPAWKQIDARTYNAILKGQPCF